MDFRFSPEEDAFREEVRALLDAELPPRWGGHLGGEFASVPWGTAEYRQSARSVAARLTAKVRERGWRPLAWPREYGGFGASIWKQVAFKEETVRRAAPTGGGLGELFIGPAIMAFGTEEQKRRHLTPIAEGRDRWCQLYSEPDAGSDLAALKTRAERDGDAYIINGQKIWTSSAPEAEWGFLFARTNPNEPRHKGVSAFLIDMKSPGITVQPLPNMIRQYDFSQVFLDQVRVPAENLLGEENRGFYIMMAAVGFERGGTLDYARTAAILDRIEAYARETPRDGRPLFDDPAIRQGIGRLRTKIEVTRLINYLTMSKWAAGDLPDWEASHGKIFQDTIYQEVVQFGFQVMGPFARLQTVDPFAVADGLVEYHMRPALHQTISPGTIEIQKNIIATRGLGLPRS